MTSLICDTQEHKKAQKLPLVHNHEQGLEDRFGREELISLVGDLLMLLALRELLYEGQKEGDLSDSVASEGLPSSQQENSEKSIHSNGCFASEDESSFLKEMPL